MSKSTARIIDDDAGFSKPFTGNRDSIESGDTKPPVGDSQSERSDERPPGKIAGFDSVSPFDILGDASDGSRGGDTSPGSGGEPRRRGRPPGSRNSTKEKVPPNLANLEDLLFSIHLALGGFVEEFTLDKSECKDYADALKELAKHYSFIVDPKKMAMINLTAVMGRIYGPRAFVAYKRMTSEKPAPRPKLVTQPAPQPKQDVNGVVNPMVSSMTAPAPGPKRDPKIAEVPSQVWPESADFDPPID
jgi:hypothetical protein